MNGRWPVETIEAARSALAAGAGVVRRHPRHLALGGLVAGILLAPVGAVAVVPAAVVAAALGGRSRAAAVAAALVIAGALAAELRLAALDAGPLAAMHGRSLTARVTLLEPVRERAVGPAVARVRVLDGPAAGEQAVLRMRASVFAGGWPEVGDELVATARVAPLGRFDAYQRRRNAHAALDAVTVRRIGGRRGGVAGALDATRRRAELGLATGLAPPEAALLRGMVLGEDERLSEDVKTDFQRSGLAHVLAVSGQNVMLLAALVLAATALTGVPLRARLGVAMVAIALYVPLAGGGPSIQRAGVMGVAGLTAALAGRPAQRWYALGLAAAVTLLLNPRAVGEPGWQLSFAAVAALLALAGPLRTALCRRMPRPVADATAITVAATAGTAPLMALYFEQVSLASLPANLLAAPAIAPAMWLGMLAAAAAQVAPGLAAPFTALAGPLLVYLQGVAHVAAGAPLAIVPIRLGSPIALAGVYAGLAATATVAVRAWRRRAARRLAAQGTAGDDAGGLAGVGGGLAGARGLAGGGGLAGGRGPIGQGGLARLGGGLAAAAVRRPAASAVAVAAVVVAVAVLALGVREPAARAPAPGELVVSFLDIGQGDATLLQRDGVAVLVDTGPAEGPVLRRLAEAGVRRLDALVLTHAQADHEGAALKVMRAYPPRLVVDGGAGWRTGVQRALPAALAAARSRRLDAHAGDVLALGAMRLHVLWPPRPGPGFRPEGDPNDRALVIHVESGAFDLLLPADAESNVTAGLALPHVEALKVAHHGSADEGLPALLTRLRPAFAAIEVGRHNRYGHPAPSTLAALRSVGRVVRTDRDGTVRLRVRGKTMRVERTGPRR